MQLSDIHVTDLVRGTQDGFFFPVNTDMQDHITEILRLNGNFLQSRTKFFKNMEKYKQFICWPVAFSVCLLH